jgi:ABC-2 type transport system ATP-binding protein
LNTVVEAINLCKTFIYQGGLRDLLQGGRPRKTLAVDNVSFFVEEKEIFGLVGPNGSGKTTLINLLCTVVVPNEGTARVGGFDILDSSADVRKAIGLVTSNERSFYWRLTGRQNLSFFSDLYGLSPRSAGTWIEELIEALDLRDFADRRFDGYSTGIRQRFAMARALLHKPRIIFMDEPTKGLDPVAAASLIRLIQGNIVAAWNPTIIVTSHNLREIEQLCSRIAIMYSGRFLCCGGLSEISRRIYPYETYRLTVGNASSELAERISKLRGVAGVSSLCENGNIDMELRIAGENGVLSAVMSTVLANGGDIRHCSALPVSLDDIFSHIISTNKGS